MTDIPTERYEDIFGKKEKVGSTTKIGGGGSKSNINLIDDNGKVINKVTGFHKNKMYKQAKHLKEELRDTMCTKSECWKPDDKNINKMINNEMRNKKVEAYKTAMKAIGADPKDCDPDRLRRR